MSDLTTLGQLKPGSTAKVSKIAGKPSFRRRILDMGLVKGTKIKIIRTAPLGDPVEFLVRGYNLSLRKNEAENIFVEVSNEK